MKKLSLVAGLLCFVFIACTPKVETTEQKPEDATEKACEQKEPKCCKGMTEEEKAACKEFCEKWKDFDNQTEEAQKELVQQAKAQFDKCDAEREAKRLEMEAKKAEFEAKWKDFDNLPLADQKALIDQKMQCKKGCCKKGGEGKSCCKKDGDGKKCPKSEEKAKCNKQ